MAITVKQIILWRKEVAHETGMLADVLEPLADGGANLRLVMGYAIPGYSQRAAIEVFPVTGRKLSSVAETAGLGPSSIPCLLVEGDDRAGLGGKMARAIADAGVNMSFLIAQTFGRKFAAAIGFANAADAAAAARAIKSAGRSRPSRRTR